MHRRSVPNFRAIFHDSIITPFKEEWSAVRRSIQRIKPHPRSRSSSRPSLAQDLPKEILDEIFGHVQAIDKGSLSQCSLVCRSWETSASRLLFCHVEFTFGYPVHEITQCRWRSFQDSSWNSQRLLINMRVLVLSTETSFVTLQTLVTNAFNLRTLDLHVTFAPLDVAPELYQMPSKRGGIEVLRLRQYTSHSRSPNLCPGLLDCLLWFTEIGELELAFWDPDIEKAMNSHLPCDQVRKATVRTLRVPHGLQLCAKILRTRLDLSAIKALDVREELNAIPSFFATSLDTICHSLAYCQFDLDDKSASPEELINFAACSQLHTIHLKCRPLGPPLDSNHTARGSCPIWEFWLRSVAQTPFLKTLVIQFCLRSTWTTERQLFVHAFLEALDYARLNSCVDSLSELEAVCIQLSFSGTSHTVVPCSAEITALITPNLSPRTRKLLSVLDHLYGEH